MHASTKKHANFRNSWSALLCLPQQQQQSFNSNSLKRKKHTRRRSKHKTSITALCPHMNFRPQVTGNCPASHPDEQYVDHGDRPSEMGVVSSENFRVCCRCHELQESTFPGFWVKIDHLMKKRKHFCFYQDCCVFCSRRGKFPTSNERQEHATEQVCQLIFIPIYHLIETIHQWRSTSPWSLTKCLSQNCEKPSNQCNWLSTTALKVGMSNLKNNSDKIRETNGKQRQLLPTFKYQCDLIWRKSSKIVHQPASSGDVDFAEYQKFRLKEMMKKLWFW